MAVIRILLGAVLTVWASALAFHYQARNGWLIISCVATGVALAALAAWEAHRRLVR